MSSGSTIFVLENGDEVGDPVQGIGTVQPTFGLKISVAKPDSTCEYEVVKWHYSLEPETPKLVVVVKPLSQYWFSRLNADQRVLLSYTLIALTLVPSGILSIMYFTNRTELLAIFGWYCNNIVGWCLFAIGAILPMRIKGWAVGPQTLLGTYLGLLCPVLGMISALAWVEISRPMQPFVDWPNDYAAYAKHLMQQLQTSLPAVISVLPWIALVAKFVDLERVGAVFEKIATKK